jgi:acetolactate synthase-1/3 small subunit
METPQKFTISVYTENNIGLLNRLSAIFLKRHINIESLTASPSEIENIHRFTFVVIMQESKVKKIVGQLDKQIEVVRAFYHSEDEIIYKETALFKVSTEHLYNEEIQDKLKFRRANIINITKEYFVIDYTGSKEDIDILYDRLKPYGIMQFVRSGRIAISRSKMPISDYIKEI